MNPLKYMLNNNVKLQSSCLSLFSNSKRDFSRCTFESTSDDKLLVIASNFACSAVNIFKPCRPSIVIFFKLNKKINIMRYYEINFIENMNTL